MQNFSKYDNLKLLLPLWRQITQDKSKITYEFGLLNFLKISKQNISPYSKVIVLENSFLRTILIGDIFDACCISIFDQGGSKVDRKE